jgi:capsular polysaccharide biosynthesis protein
MQLRELLDIVLRRWWIVVVAVALTAGSAVLFGQLAVPEYTARAEVAIVPSRPDLGLTQSVKHLLRMYMTVADSDTWAQEVITKLGYDMQPSVLRQNVHFAAQDDRMVITIEVEDHDRLQAEAIAKAWADELEYWRNSQNAELRQEDRVTTELRDYPKGQQTWPPSWKLLLAAGGVLGIAVAGVVILFVEYIEARIYQTPHELERELGLSVLAAIPRSK